MTGWLQRHSLSLALGAGCLVLLAASCFTTPEPWDVWLGEAALEIAGGLGGGLAMVLATKRLIEIGSAESKNDPDDDG